MVVCGEDDDDHDVGCMYFCGGGVSLCPVGYLLNLLKLLFVRRLGASYFHCCCRCCYLVTDKACENVLKNY